MAAALSPGVVCVSHRGAAARLRHDSDGFDRHDLVDVLGVKGANPHQRLGIAVHRARRHRRARRRGHGHPGPVDRRHTRPAGAGGGHRATVQALDGALRLGADPDELRRVAQAWRQRGRARPPALLMLLGERVDARLPRSWFQRIAGRILATAGIRLVGGFDPRPARQPARRARSRRSRAQGRHRVPELAVARHAGRPAPRRPPAGHAASARLGDRRRLVGDLAHPERVIAQVLYLLSSRPAASARSGRS